MAQWNLPSRTAHSTSFKLLVLLIVVGTFIGHVAGGEDLGSGKTPVKPTEPRKKSVIVDEKKISSPKASPSSKDTLSAPEITLNSNPTAKAPDAAPVPTAASPSSAEPKSDDHPSNESSTTTNVAAPKTVDASHDESATRKSEEKPVIASTRSPFSTDEITMPPPDYHIGGDYANQTDETHDYYNSSIILDEAQANALWIELDDLNETVTHEMLSESYRRAATVNLTFDFPFYGHPINNVTIATGGFLYVGYKLHMWLAATQYIAPLMANFKASVNSSESSLKYYDNGTIFVVEWRNVHLEDDKTAGNFTFQAILKKNGDIIFVYKQIPIKILEIAEKHHPVKVGISDAYLFQRTVYLLKRKTIYEYHSINKKSGLLTSNTAIVIKALPTCVSLKSCEECTTAQINFNCTWCEAVQRCSSGVDRHRQSWMNNKCEENVTPKGQCLTTETMNALASADNASSSSGSSAGLQALFVIIALVLGVSLWVFYAYRNPRSPSGQFLIKYRPSQWKRHGEARYIAAGSLHM